MPVILPLLRQGFNGAGYICDECVVLTVYLALALQKPLLIEGALGVGKAEMDKVLAEILETELIRLQCYEGLDETKALYEWNYQRQLLRIQMNRSPGSGEIREDDLFSMHYRPCDLSPAPAGGGMVEMWPCNTKSQLEQVIAGRLLRQCWTRTKGGALI